MPVMENQTPLDAVLNVAAKPKIRPDSNMTPLQNVQSRIVEDKYQSAFDEHLQKNLKTIISKGELPEFDGQQFEVTDAMRLDAARQAVEQQYDDYKKSAPARIRSTAKWVPALKMASDAAEQGIALKAVKDIAAGKADENDYISVAMYLKEADEKSKQSLLADVRDIAQDIPGFMVAMVGSGGLAAAGKEATEQALKKVTRRGIAKRVAGSLAGNLARLSHPMTYGVTARNVLQRELQKSLPKGQDAQGNLEFKEKSTFLQSLPEGIASSYIEFLTEQAGAAVNSKVFRRKVIKPVLGKWASVTGNTLDDAWAKVASEGGYDGIIAELGEERLSEVLHGVTQLSDDYGATGALLSGDVKGAGRQLAAEGIAFGVIPGAQAVGRAADTQMSRKQRADAWKPIADKWKKGGSVHDAIMRQGKKATSDGIPREAVQAIASQPENQEALDELAKHDSPTRGQWGKAGMVPATAEVRQQFVKDLRDIQNASQVPEDQGSVDEEGDTGAGSAQDRSAEVRVQGQDEASAEAAGEDVANPIEEQGQISQTPMGGEEKAAEPQENPTKGVKFYRGTRKDDAPTDPGDMGEGSYYSSDKTVAATYGTVTEETELPLKNPLVTTQKKARKLFGNDVLPDERIMPRVREILGDERSAEIEAQVGGTTPPDLAKAFTQAVQEFGYDGVVFKPKGKDAHGMEAVVFGEKAQEQAEPAKQPPQVDVETTEQPNKSEFQTRAEEYVNAVPMWKGSSVSVDEDAKTAKVTVPSGNTATIYFDADPMLDSIEKHAKGKQKGLKGRGAYVYQKNTGKKGGIKPGIYLRQSATHETINHEAIHWAEDNGIITKAEVRRHGGREGMATKYAKWVLNGKKRRVPVFDRLYKAIDGLLDLNRGFRGIEKRTQLFETEGNQQATDEGVESTKQPSKSEITAAMEQEIAKQKKLKRSQRKAKEAEEKKQKAIEALKKLGRSNKTTSGLDPSKVAEAAKAAILIADYGITKFDQYVSLAVETLGESVVRDLAPYLEEAARQVGIENVTSVSDELRKREPPKQRPAPSETTGVKHAKTDELAAEIGMKERVTPEPQTTEQWDEEAARLIREDPQLPYRLSNELAYRPHATGPIEQAVLNRHLRDLGNRRKAGEDVIDDMVTTITADREVGTIWGREGVERQVEYARDFSLAGFIRRHISEFDEHPTAEDIEKYTEMQKQIEQLQAEVDEARSKAAQEQAWRVIAEEKAKAAQEKSKEGRKERRATRKARIHKQQQDAVAEFKQAWAEATKGGSTATMSGLDPERLAALGKAAKAATKVVKAYVEANVDSFIELMAKVRQDLGNVNQEQEQLFREAWDKENIQSPMGLNPEPSVVGVRARKLARYAVERGIEDQHEVVLAVQEALENEGVSMTEVEVMEAISQYGEYQEFRDRSHAANRVREIRGELRNELKLRDIEAGRVPKLTGREQAKLSEEGQRLQKLVYEGMKKLGLRTPDPRKLATPLESKHRAVNKRLKALDEEITSLSENIIQGTPMKQDGQRTELVVDEELIRKQELLDAKLAERDELRKQSPQWQAQEDARARQRYVKNLEKRLEFWQDRAEKARQGVLPEKRPEPKYRGEYRQKEDELIRAKHEALAEIEKEKRKRWNLGQKIASGIGEAAALLPRQIMAGLELSVVLRQGFFYAHSHPFMALISAANSVASVFNKRYALAQEESIRHRANYKEYDKADIQFTTESGPMDTVEELYQSALFTYLKNTNNVFLSPLKGVALAYEAFERGFRTFSNLMKADLYDVHKRDALAIREVFDKAGIKSDQGWSEKDMKLTGRTANILSGRGTDMRAGRSFLDYVLFARRWVWSRIQAEFILPIQIATPGKLGQWHGDKALRVAHAKLYAQTLLGAAAHLAGLYFMFALMADDEDEKPTIESSPLSTDFLKLKTGNTRIDVLGGLPQLVVLANRFFRGKTKNYRGEIVSIRGEDAEYGQPDTFEVLSQWARYKLSPGASGALDFFTQESAIGQQLSEDPLERAGQVIGDRMLPMAYTDMWDAEKELGIPKGAIVALEAFFGASVSTYGERTRFRKASKEERKELFDKDLKYMKWNDPVIPEYQEYISKDQVEQYAKRRREKQGAVMYNATYVPNSTTEETKQKAQETIAKNREYLEQMRNQGVTHLEAQKLLAEYAGASGKKGSYEVAKRSLAEIYSTEFRSLPKSDRKAISDARAEAIRNRKQ